MSTSPMHCFNAMFDQSEIAKVPQSVFEKIYTKAIDSAIPKLPPNIQKLLVETKTEEVFKADPITFNVEDVICKVERYGNDITFNKSGKFDTKKEMKGHLLSSLGDDVKYVYVNGDFYFNIYEQIKHKEIDIYNSIIMIHFFGGNTIVYDGRKLTWSSTARYEDALQTFKEFELMELCPEYGENVYKIAKKMIDRYA